MSDTNAIIDKWMGARYWRVWGQLQTYCTRTINSLECDGLAAQEIKPAEYKKEQSLLDYTTDANLIQPMLDRCVDVGWDCCGPTWRPGGGWKVMLRCDVMYRNGSSASLSEAITQAIVAMIEATNQGETE